MGHVIESPGDGRLGNRCRGPFGAIKESLATGKALAEVKLQGCTNALIDAVVQDIATPEGRENSKPSKILSRSRNSSLISS
jgi:hypothetical protein